MLESCAMYQEKEINMNKDKEERKKSHRREFVFQRQVWPLPRCLGDNFYIFGVS